MTGRGDPGDWGRIARTLSAATALAVSGIFLWSGEIAEFKWMNHDAANALYIGEKILHGDLLYVDWYYFVMPPIVFLDAAVCFVAERVGLSPPSVNHLLVVATALLGLSVLSLAFADARSRRSGRYAVAMLAYLSLLARPGLFWPFYEDFGQREHLFALLLVPYCIWRLSDAPVVGRVLALAVALGYAMMNKPHFLVLVAMIEIHHLLETREIRTSMGAWAALAGGAILPFALLVLDSPESASALFTQAFAYHLSDSYESFSMPWSEFLSSSRNITIVAIAIGAWALLLTAWRRNGLSAHRALLVGALIAASYLIFLEQQKLFRYHSIPFMAIALVSSALLAWTIASTLTHPLLRRGLEYGVLALLFFQIGSGVIGLWKTVSGETRANVMATLPFLEELERAHLVAIFSPSVEGRLFDLTFDHELEIMRPWSSNYTLGALLATRDPVERERLVRWYFEPLARRIREEAPDLVVFSPMNQSLPRGTLHDWIVDRYRLFPFTQYSERKRYANGWVVYRRAGSD